MDDAARTFRPAPRIDEPDLARVRTDVAAWPVEDGCDIGPATVRTAIVSDLAGRPRTAGRDTPAFGERFVQAMFTGLTQVAPTKSGGGALPDITADGLDRLGAMRGYRRERTAVAVAATELERRPFTYLPIPGTVVPVPSELEAVQAAAGNRSRAAAPAPTEIGAPSEHAALAEAMADAVRSVLGSANARSVPVGDTVITRSLRSRSRVFIQRRPAVPRTVAFGTPASVRVARSPARRRTHARTRHGGNMPLALRMLLWPARAALAARIPGTDRSAFPVIAAAALIAASAGAGVMYERTRGDAYIAAARSGLPGLVADLTDAYTADRTLARSAAELDPERGGETVARFGIAAKALGDRARATLAKLRDLELRLAAGARPTFGPLEPAAAHEARDALQADPWQAEAAAALTTWLRRGESGQKLADALKGLVAIDPAREWKIDPLSARNEALVRLDALAKELGRTAETLAQLALSAGAESPAARLAPRVTQIAETAARARTAVDVRDRAEFDRLGTEYAALVGALRGDALGELRATGSPPEDGTVERLLARAARSRDRAMNAR